ncbi:histidine phosphatase family protein [Paenibacillus aurantius]|uniref:Histidine phosphatase family protein n=1 Tax=Paenibacillus aurantius TaxID=2918900 RepID=A0AA96RBQ2_9BACL|nr:histidine phosphatase family protein [Paenibacillus aurantius]
MVTSLFLTRHGETEWNLDGKIQGHKDSPLTMLGKQQAGWLCDALGSIQINAIYSSTSQRAYETAEILRGQREINIVKNERLMEINMGTWEGHERKHIETIYPDEYYVFSNTPHLYKPQNGGESFIQLQNRIIPTIRDIILEHIGKNVLIITHAISLKVIMAYFRGESLENLWAPPFMRHTALNKVVMDGSSVHIELYGDLSHCISLEA